MDKNTEISEHSIGIITSSFEKMIQLRNVPQKIFDSFQKVFGGTSLEVVPIRYDHEGQIEVFMVKRSEKDTFWSNEYHVPGTMVFAWDYFGDGFKKAWDRLKVTEITHSENGVSNPVTTLPLETRRGAETAVIYNLVFKGPTSSVDGEWISVNNLQDKKIIEHHKTILFEGLNDFVASVKSGHYSDQSLSTEAIENMVGQLTRIKRK